MAKEVTLTLADIKEMDPLMVLSAFNKMKDDNWRMREDRDMAQRMRDTANTRVAREAGLREKAEKRAARVTTALGEIGLLMVEQGLHNLLHAQEDEEEIQ